MLRRGASVCFIHLIKSLLRMLSNYHRVVWRYREDMDWWLIQIVKIIICLTSIVEEALNYMLQ